MDKKTKNKVKGLDVNAVIPKVFRKVKPGYPKMASLSLKRVDMRPLPQVAPKIYFESSYKIR